MWLILKSEANGPLRAELASELVRRVDTDLLTAPDVAVLIDAADPTWLPIQLRIVDTLTAAHLEMGPSVASVWRQAHPDHPDTEPDWPPPSHPRSPRLPRRRRRIPIPPSPSNRIGRPRRPH